MRKTETRSTQEVVRDGRDVKGWALKEPTVEELRPACCLACGAASRPAGGGLVLHGHGRRGRQAWGPATATGKPEVRDTWVQRFLCKLCEATMTVAPRELLTKRLYSAAAIALALALFGLARVPLPEVRARVSPWGVVGHTAAASWASVSRWTEAVREGRLFEVRRPPEEWTPRQVAERTATTLAARAPAEGELLTAAFRGALADG